MVESMQFPAYIQVILTSTIILQDRIISKEEEREDPRRELQSSFQLESKSVSHAIQQRENFSLHSSSNPSSVSTCNQAKSPSFQSFHTKKTILHTELILLQEISKKYYNYKAHPVHTDRRHPPTSVPHAFQAFYTAESSYKAPTVHTGFQ